MPTMWLAENSQIRFLALSKSKFRTSALTAKKPLLLIAIELIIKIKPKYVVLIIYLSKFSCLKLCISRQDWS